MQPERRKMLRILRYQFPGQEPQEWRGEVNLEHFRYIVESVALGGATYSVVEEDQS